MTRTLTEVFTITHARHIAAKVATDLLRFSRFYGRPSPEQIDKYEAELVELLKFDYLGNVIYGFKRDGKWVEALRYHALPGGTLIDDDDPGRIRPGTVLPGDSFGSFLTKNSRWNALSSSQQAEFEARIPVSRGDAPEPPLLNGRWVEGRTYSAQGRGITRSIIER